MPNPVTTIYVTCKDLFFTISSFFSHLVKGSLKIEIESNFYSLQDSLVPETVNRKSGGAVLRVKSDAMPGRASSGVSGVVWGGHVL